MGGMPKPPWGPPNPCMEVRRGRLRRRQMRWKVELEGLGSGSAVARCKAGALSNVVRWNARKSGVAAHWSVVARELAAECGGVRVGDEGWAGGGWEEVDGRVRLSWADRCCAPQSHHLLSSEHGSAQLSLRLSSWRPRAQQQLTPFPSPTSPSPPPPSTLSSPLSRPSRRRVISRTTHHAPRTSMDVRHAQTPELLLPSHCRFSGCEHPPLQRRALRTWLR